MDDANISSDSTTLVTTSPEPGEPQAWWQAPINDNPWWYDTPNLLSPLQEKAWYLPETKAEPLAYLNTAPKVTAGPVLMVGAVLAVVGVVAALAARGGYLSNGE